MENIIWHILVEWTKLSQCKAGLTGLKFDSYVTKHVGKYIDKTAGKY